MTANQKEYKKQIKRIENFIKKKQKEGFIFTELPKDMPSLTIPKRVTKKALENIKSFKTQSLYKGSIFVSEAGTTSGLEEVRRRKKAAAKKRSITMRSKPLKRIRPGEDGKKRKYIEYIPKFNFIDRIREMLESIERKAYPKYDIEQRKGLLLRTFEDSLNIYDEVQFSKYLQENESLMMDLIGIIEYDSSQDTINASFLRLMMILNVVNLTAEQLEDISEFNEFFNSETEV